MMKPLTFSEFQATGRDVDDLRRIIPDLVDMDRPIPARVYTDSNLYLEPARDKTDGPLIVEVGNAGWQGSLEQCESFLYGYYLREIADEEFFEELMAKASEVARRFWS